MHTMLQHTGATFDADKGGILRWLAKGFETRDCTDHLVKGMVNHAVHAAYMKQCS